MEDKRRSGRAHAQRPTLESAGMSALRLPAAGTAGQARAKAMEALGRSFVRAEVRPLHPKKFAFDAVLRILPGLSIVSGCIGGALVQRTPALLSDGNNDFIFVMAVSGAVTVSQEGRRVLLAPGEGVLLSCAAEASLVFPGDARFIAIRAPNHVVVCSLLDTGAAPLRTTPEAAQALQMLSAYLSSIDESCALQGSLPDLEAGRAVAAHVQQLVILALSQRRRVIEPPADQRRPSVRLRAIQLDIATLLGNPELSVALVAARHGVTPRYVQKLFKAKGSSFSGFVLERRLELAYRRLRDPAFTGHSVTEVAYEAGFNDLSYFNRVFRRLFGAAPSTVRPAASRRQPAMTKRIARTRYETG